MSSLPPLEQSHKKDLRARPDHHRTRRCEAGAAHTTLRRARFLITGATGFIGSHLVETLENNRHEVLKLVRFEEKENVPRSSTLVTDLAKMSVLRRAVRDLGPGIVVHLAAAVDSTKSYKVSKETITTNILGTLNLMEALKDSDIQKFIHIGTEEVYGSGSPPFHESDPLDPRTPYAISKATSEWLAMLYHRRYSTPVVLLRFGTIYGPRQNPRKLIPMTILSALAGQNIYLHSSEQRRSFLYVDDAVDAILRVCFAQNNIDGEILNIGSTESYAVEEIVSHIINLLGNPVKVIAREDAMLSSDPKAVLSDISKAERLLGWHPTISLEKGLKRTITWYKRNRNWKTGR